jgi:hypothetical protein
MVMVKSFPEAVSQRFGVPSDRIEAGIQMLKGLDPLSLSDLESEMTLMHLASVVDPANEFKDNYNISPARRPQYIDLVSIIMDSDPAAWCHRLVQSSFWRNSEVIANIVWNWLNGTLDNPTTF